jgi:hypothetical protein
MAKCCQTASRSDSLHCFQVLWESDISPRMSCYTTASSSFLRRPSASQRRISAPRKRNSSLISMSRRVPHKRRDITHNHNHRGEYPHGAGLESNLLRLQNGDRRHDFQAPILYPRRHRRDQVYASDLGPDPAVPGDSFNFVAHTVDVITNQQPNDFRTRSNKTADDEEDLPQNASSIQMAVEQLHKQIGVTRQFYGGLQSDFSAKVDAVMNFAGPPSLDSLWREKLSKDEQMKKGCTDARNKLKYCMRNVKAASKNHANNQINSQPRGSHITYALETILRIGAECTRLAGLVEEQRWACECLVKELGVLKSLVDPNGANVKTLAYDESLGNGRGARSVESEAKAVVFSGNSQSQDDSLELDEQVETQE